MTLVVRCSSCNHAFEAAVQLAGGFTNCPACGKATAVEGLRDPIWRLWQVGAAVGIVGLGVVVGRVAGPLAGSVVVVVGLAAAWLVSRAF